MRPRLTRQQVNAIHAKERDKAQGKRLYRHIVFPTGAVYIRYKRFDGTLMGGYFQKFGDTHFPSDRQQWPEFERWAMTQPRSAGVIKPQAERQEREPQDTNSKFDNPPPNILHILTFSSQQQLFVPVKPHRQPDISWMKTPIIYDLQQQEEYKRDYDAFTHKNEMEMYRKGKFGWYRSNYSGGIDQYYRISSLPVSYASKKKNQYDLPEEIEPLEEPLEELVEEPPEIQPFRSSAMASLSRKMRVLDTPTGRISRPIKGVEPLWGVPF